ncbi:hypothetical protein K449DRAFT_452070 [Hypoxylon sp. EC38]|nr:hypothetical protein K449DRAFT_452070 [Hypoxylon sp. EC38]
MYCVSVSLALARTPLVPSELCSRIMYYLFGCLDTYLEPSSASCDEGILDHTAALLHEKIRDIVKELKNRISIRRKFKFALHGGARHDQLVDHITCPIDDLLKNFPAATLTQGRLCADENVHIQPQPPHPGQYSR